MRIIAQIAVASALLCVVLLAHAAPKFGMAGCGLGSMVFDPYSGWTAQTSAATSNSTAWNQGFGITSGTSNCLEPGQMAQIQAQQQFIADNLNVLSKEMARGDGEYLQAFSQTMGCQSIAYPEFGKQMRSSYRKIFLAPGAMAVLTAVRKEIKGNPYLKNHCDPVI